MRTCVAAAIAAVLLAGCAAGPPPKPVAIGGSKSDATVEMAASYNPHQHDNADWSTADAEASQRCQVWGYERAEPFGSEFKRCTYRDSIYGICAEITATRAYQCIGETK